MAHEIHDAEQPLVFLYKVVKGVSGSYAIEVAAAIGIDQQIANRAKEIFEALKSGKQITPLPELAGRQRCPPGVPLEEFLKTVNIPRRL